MADDLMAPKPLKKEQVSQFFYFLFAANILMYMEAGIVPASLLPLAGSFDMSLSEQGLLGGIVFLSIAFAGPFAGYFLRHYEHRSVLGVSLAIFNVLTFCWALTPTEWLLSSDIFIVLRFLMGLCQCVCCVFFPLWTNDYAPRRSTASWMSLLQASVPFGVMAGYILASIVLRFSNDNNTCFVGIYCWRIPLLLEATSLLPFTIIIFFIPRNLIRVRMGSKHPIVAAMVNVEHDSPTLSYGSIDPPPDAQGRTVAITPDRAHSRNRWYSDDASSGVSLAGGITASMTPLRLKRRQGWREDQRQSYRKLRRSSMAASIYDSMAARDVLRQSHSSLAILDAKDDHILGMISSGGLRWIDSDTEENDDNDDDGEIKNENFIDSGAPSIDDKRNKYMKQLDRWEEKLKIFFKKDIDVDIDDSLELGGTIRNKNSIHRRWSMPSEPTEELVPGSANEEDRLLPESRGSSRSNSFDSEPGSVEEVLDNEGRPVDLASITLCQALFTLAKMPVYRSVVLSMAALYFVVTGVQFWGTSYMIIALDTPVLMVQCFFIFVAATAPTSGVIFGGWYLDKRGGYKGVKQRYIALKICLAFGSAGLFWTFLTIFTKNFYLVVAYIWLILFCGGATLPGCSGIAVSVVPAAYRAYSSSISLIIFNLFGYFLSVALSGVLMQVVTTVYPWCDEACSRTFGFRLVLLWSIWSIIFLIVAVVAAKGSFERKLQAEKLDSIESFNKRFQTLVEA